MVTHRYHHDAFWKVIYGENEWKDIKACPDIQKIDILTFWCSNSYPKKMLVQLAFRDVIAFKHGTFENGNM